MPTNLFMKEFYLLIVYSTVQNFEITHFKCNVFEKIPVKIMHRKYLWIVHLLLYYSC